MVEDRQYMILALRAAERGRGYTGVNPLVGALIVRDGEVVGEGWHEHYGGAHAEVNALKRAGEASTGATMYVTLEPCSHYGKTPPCCEAIVRAGISRVVCPMVDPNPQVSGKGFAYLKEHGVEVVTGIMEREAAKLNEVFLHYITTSRPFVTIKTAMSLDGKIATAAGNSRWISGERSREYVHTLRHQSAAIAVGVNTIIADNPLLTTRMEGKATRNPLRIIYDSSGRIPLDARVLNTLNLSPVLLFSTPSLTSQRKRQYELKGAEVFILSSSDRTEMVRESLKILAERQVNSLLVEGGGTLIDSFFAADSVNRYITHIAPMIIGGAKAPTPVSGLGVDTLEKAYRFGDVTVERMGEDVVVSATGRRRG